MIRQVRNQHVQSDWIRAKLNKSEANGFTDETSEQILKQSKSLLSVVLEFAQRTDNEIENKYDRSTVGDPQSKTLWVK